MLDLTTKVLPDTVTVDGRAFYINTDFRIWLKFERDLKTHSVDSSTFDISYVFKEEMPTYIDVAELKSFVHPEKELPRRIGAPSNDILLDLDLDSDLIYSAFMEQYNIDLTTVDMHWHKFLALLAGISEKTMLGRVMGYRSYNPTDDKKKDVRKELKRAWEIKQQITTEEQAEIDEFNSYFA